jgi:tetratricopeptide (TPR) repeat protein
VVAYAVVSEQALETYQELLKQDDPDPLYYTYSAACYYYMGLYKDAEEHALQVCGHASAPLIHYTPAAVGMPKPTRKQAAHPRAGLVYQI